ncbi:MAG: aminoglycoside phosphotransferase family protein [Allosphingosinicella sp.]|uniref:aminoglycoside phosphotransferase family protein n=1 Tax=Allosphingosinicella sp. TaxID=2823234 RepID=UPI003927CFD8
MIPPSHAPRFLALNGWEGARILPLAGDASFRRYFRVVKDGARAVLMDAPPEHEDVGPFMRIAGHLIERGFAPPCILAADVAGGLLLLEDFGDDRVGPLLQREPGRERDIYEAAIDILADLHREPAPRDLDPYGEEAMTREVGLLTEWYAPAVGVAPDEGAWLEAWRSVWGGILETVNRRPVLVLRDYHADNLMVLDDPRRLGLLDFQDALAGHPAYDLVSLLQDARRDVSEELEEAMIARYLDKAKVEDAARFRADYEILGAQRNSKILGIFTRLWRRDGKAHYTAFQPRVWSYLERNLAHPALAPVRGWFDAHIGPDKRAAAWQTDAAA